ncbi:hypothetical protein BU23DRAFT_596822 [Bimuria novae-zelandiae CBS 107.79]|uniref:Uncharacterized protein n=1 Tax=Bimuria novae-zelandiae CBS 107.79 TaxID=1447943 RepID=A0A6A5VKA7_9PLEO|nr:hypothetical protein BU23DRAFT_596822 [Bimuria novae-zelandiae CBS 107.79]
MSPARRRPVGAMSKDNVTRWANMRFLHEYKYMIARIRPDKDSFWTVVDASERFKLSAYNHVLLNINMFTPTDPQHQTKWWKFCAYLQTGNRIGFCRQTTEKVAIQRSYARSQDGASQESKDKWTGGRSAGFSARQWVMAVRLAEITKEVEQLRVRLAQADQSNVQLEEENAGLKVKVADFEAYKNAIED